MTMFSIFPLKVARWIVWHGVPLKLLQGARASNTFVVLEEAGLSMPVISRSRAMDLKSQ